MRTIESINLIYRDPKVRGGRPCIVGTGLRVTDIVMEQRYGEPDPKKIATRYQITLAQVHTALAYYHLHKDEIDKDIRDWEEFDEQITEKELGKSKNSLLL